MVSVAVPSSAGSNHARALIALIGVAIFINYVDRGNLATAGPLIKDELRLDNTAFGLLVSAFFWAYAPGQLVAGWLAQRYCAYRVLAAGLAIWAVATMATGLVGGFLSLFVLRLILGLGESVAFPASSKLFCDHLPPERYGAGNAATAMGLSIGPAFGIFAGGMLMASIGWRPSFLIFGAVSLLWLIPWLRLPRTAVAPHAVRLPPPSFGQIMRKREAWGASLAHFCGNYSFYFVLAWLPLYLVKVHGFAMTDMAAIGGLVYLAQGISSALFGWLADRWIAGGASVNRARMTMMVAGNLVIVVCLLLPISGNVWLSVGALVVFGAFTGMTASNLFASGQTLAGPRAGGKWIGFQNFFGNCAGIVAPAITGWLVDRSGGFSVAFALASAITLVAALSWLLIVRRIAPVEWN